MQALVSVIMGSISDWETMAHAVEMLDKLAVPCDVRVLSAHRTPDQLFDYMKSAEGAGVEGAAREVAYLVRTKNFWPQGDTGAVKTRSEKPL